MSEFTQVYCNICGKKAKIIQKNAFGYMLPKTYDLFYCGWCDTSFVHPLEIDKELYNTIYKQSRYILGYDRYTKYAKEISKRSEPIKYLMKSEDIYYAVAKSLIGKFQNIQKNKIKILEIGCGLGYLTYALNRYGYCAVGLDVSEAAVTQAKELFGDFYVCNDIIEYSKSNSELYDVVIFTEVIEHIPNINQFMTAAFRTVKKNGLMILTTPNKSSFPNDAVWMTELFPVHLWWLSEKSISVLAKTIGGKFSLFDMARCPNANYSHYQPESLNKIPNSVLAQSGKIISTRYHFMKFCFDLINYFHMFNKMRLIRDRLLKYKVTEKPYSLCAIIRK